MTVALIAASVVACSSQTMTVFTDGGEAPPVEGTYTLVFPAVSVAVYAQTVQVLVFPAGDADSQCRSLILEQGLGALPPPVVPSQSVPICELVAPGSSGNLAVGFGSYAVLVVVQTSGEDIAIGCAEQTITAGDPNVTVTLEQSVVPPETTCMTLSASCAGDCPK
jgi:hypothetical protein